MIRASIPTTIRRCSLICRRLEPRWPHKLLRDSHSRAPTPRPVSSIRWNKFSCWFFSSFSPRLLNSKSLTRCLCYWEIYVMRHVWCWIIGAIVSVRLIQSLISVSRISLSRGWRELPAIDLGAQLSSSDVDSLGWSLLRCPSSKLPHKKKAFTVETIERHKSQSS